MKTKNFFYLLLLPLFTFTMVSCQNEEDENTPEEEVNTPEKEEGEGRTIIRLGDRLTEVTDVTGTIYYNAELGCWLISVHLAGSIDSEIIYFPVSLDEAFKVEGLKVDFSGTTYELEKSLLAQIPQTGGAEYYVIDVKEMAEYSAVEDDEQFTNEEIEQLLHQSPVFDLGLDEYSRLRNQIYAARDEGEANEGGWRIQRNADGMVTRVLFEDITQKLPPSSGHDFLVRFFGEEIANQFISYREDSWSNQIECYKQYCGNLEVSSFRFQYDSSHVMTGAYGEYIPTQGLSPKPTISSKLACKIYASYLDAPIKAINDQPTLCFELIPDGTRFIPYLIYFVETVRPEGLYIGHHGAWIDAHTGRLIAAFPIWL